MTFTDWEFHFFLVVVFGVYWALGRWRRAQNVALLVASYVFYGWIHPWFCILIATSTIVDYGCARGIAARPAQRRIFLGVSLATNLGLLGAFKYFNFFADNVHAVLTSVGLELDPITFRVFLPVGISFYTFQTLGYTIDVYRGRIEARTSFLDVAVFVALFPQLVAGPIERAGRLLPQVEARRTWSWPRFSSAFPLLVSGYFKKLVVADNLAPMVGKVYLLESPPLVLFAVGTAAFAVQILSDFSAYTDLARGIARLLGFELMENFDHPYAAVSPSDFWRRWHISFSSWIRDYVYIPLGGRADRPVRFVAVLVASLGLSGLWHGAAWHFVAWGLYHAFLVFGYHRLGLGGRWRPRGVVSTAGARAVMLGWTLIGWSLFRASSLAWWLAALTSPIGVEGDALVAAATVASFVAFYATLLGGLGWLSRERPGRLAAGARVFAHAAMILLTVVLGHEGEQSFIYFQF